MTRKTHKGIVGKAEPTKNTRYEVGAGIGFVEEDLTTSNEIEKAVEKRMKK